MKNLKIWSLIALFAMVFVGCGGDDNDNLDQSGINGTWYLTSMCGSAPEFNVYIEFNNSGKFNIYQQVWTLTYERYTGTYSVDGNVINRNCVCSRHVKSNDRSKYSYRKYGGIRDCNYD